MIEYDRTLRATSDRVVTRLASLSLEERQKKREEAIIRLGGVLEEKSGSPAS